MNRGMYMSLVALVCTIGCSKPEMKETSGTYDRESAVEKTVAVPNSESAITDEDILNMLSGYADQLCTCSTTACANEVTNAAQSDSIYIAVKADDPMMLKARLGNRMAPWKKRWDRCMRRVRFPSGITQ